MPCLYRIKGSKHSTVLTFLSKKLIRSKTLEFLTSGQFSLKMALK